MNLVWLDHGIGGEGKEWARSAKAARNRIEVLLDTELSSHESSYYGLPLWRSGPTELISDAAIYPNMDGLDEEKMWGDYPIDALLMEIGYYGDQQPLRDRLAKLGEVVFDYQETATRHVN